MRITFSYQGKEEARHFDRVEVLVGRVSPLSAPDLDLSSDPTISRKHARIRLEGEQFWIEDLKSTNGTMVNGEFILKSKVDRNSTVRVGETMLKIDLATSAASTSNTTTNSTSVPVAAPAKPATPAIAAVPKVDSEPTRPPVALPSTPAKPAVPAIPTIPPAPAAPAAAKPAPTPTIPPKPVFPAGPVIAAPAAAPVIPAPTTPAVPAAPKPVVAPVPVPVAAAPVVVAPAMPVPAVPVVPVVAPPSAGDVAALDFRKRLGQLYDVPLQHSAETRLDMLLQLIVQRVVNLIPGAKRGALLLQDRVKDKLHLRASVPLGEVIVSETLARRVMTEGHGFILERGEAGGAALDPHLIKVETGMYAPLLLKEKPLGALYIDNPGRTAPFSEDDMQFLLAAAHFVALVIHNQQLQEDLKHNSTLLERVSTKFPPAVQERLLDNVRHGLFRPGGDKSEVTILFADLRDFNTSSAQLDVKEVVQMLNEYFPVLVEAIFRYGGTIDKFAGDAIVAVFGSPEPDTQQHEKAVCAALAMLGALRDLNGRRNSKGAPILEIGIGVHCGDLLNGFFGGSECMEFTIVGEDVGKAGMFCKGAHNGELLLGPEVYQKVFKIIEAERVNLPKAFGDQHAYRVKGLKT